MKALVIGMMRAAVRRRQRAITSMKMYFLGLGICAQRLRLRRLRTARLFAAGVFPMWLRTKGAPTGFKYGQKVIKSAVKGPKMKGIFWDTLSDVKDTIWSKKTKAGVLKELFPDIKDLFLNSWYQLC